MKHFTLIPPTLARQIKDLGQTKATPNERTQDGGMWKVGAAILRHETDQNTFASGRIEIPPAPFSLTFVSLCLRNATEERVYEVLNYYVIRTTWDVLFSMAIVHGETTQSWYPG